MTETLQILNTKENKTIIGLRTVENPISITNYRYGMENSSMDIFWIYNLVANPATDQNLNL